MQGWPKKRWASNLSASVFHGACFGAVAAPTLYAPYPRRVGLRVKGDALQVFHRMSLKRRGGLMVSTTACHAGVRQFAARIGNM